ncbi:MAG: carotenoid biosynthesis protein [bacterium]
MERKKFTEGRAYLVLYLIFAVGIAGHYTENYYSLMLWITPYVLLMCGAFSIYLSGEFRSKKFLLWFLSAYVLTLLIEIVGVKTGMIFGEYSYGVVLGAGIGGVPLIVGFNWVLLILGSFNIARIAFKNNLLRCLLTATLLVMMDLLIEPVAVKLGYWQWESAIIPLQNYIAWFVISLFAAISLARLNLNNNNNTFMHYYISILIFFLMLNFLNIK